MKTHLSRLHALQFRVQTGQVKQNQKTVARLLDGISGPGLVVLPELWATGFAAGEIVDLAGLTPGLLDWLGGIARERDLVIAGSLAEPRGEGLPFNTLYLVGREGVLGRYRKQHLFTHWGEHLWFAPGNRPDTILAGETEVGALVCYDLRFPELARGQGFAGAGLMVVSAQWPLVRIDQWRILLQARAVENQCPVVAANSCGREGDTVFGGHSLIVGADGAIRAEAGQEEACVETEVTVTDMAAVRKRFVSVAERPWPGEDADKIVDPATLVRRLEPMRSQGSRIVFTNGCFDLLHPGHVSYLQEARRTGDLLVVGLNSDRSVRGLKGAGRPVNSEQSRARVLAALGCVDFVTLFDDNTPAELIRLVRPHVLVKGADWPEEKIVGAAEVRARGGRVVRIAFSHRCSTTGLIEKIRNMEESVMATIKVEGMKCKHCAGNASKALEELGLTNVQVDLQTGEISFEGEAAMDDIRAAISAKGYRVVE